MRTLPAKARAVVALRYWEDLSVDQAAQVLGCTPGNVKSQSARAQGKLRAGLAAAEAETGTAPADGSRRDAREAQDG